MKFAAAVAIILTAVNCIAEPLFDLNYIVEKKFLTCNKEQVMIPEKDKKLTLVLPAGAEAIKLSIDYVAMKKGNWSQYNTFLLEIENTSLETVSLKLNFIRRAIDDSLIQEENPLYDRKIILLPGKNTIKLNVESLSGSPSRVFLVEETTLIFKNETTKAITLKIKELSVLYIEDE